MHVADADANRPVTDVQISLCRSEAPRYCHRLSGKSSKGLYQALVPAAPFAINVSAAGYEDSDSVGAPQPVQLVSETTKELTILLHKIGTTDSVSKLLPAPQNMSPADGAIFNHFPRTTTLEWSAVPGAVSYTVELDLCDWERPNGTECKVAHPLTTWRVPPTSGIEGTSYQFVFLGSQPGRWRVWAVDAQGRAGAKPPWFIFVYSDH